MSECTRYQMRCYDGQCFNIEKRCDGVEDCSQGEDEAGCGMLIHLSVSK